MQIKWCKQLSEKISVCIGTRQGGISSPLLFNIFYQELVDALSKCPGGISINSDSFNVFCYADDLILTATATKTICTSLGAKHFETTAEWYLLVNGSVLRGEAAISYLGTVLSRNPKLQFFCFLRS